ncbi:carboxyl transferase domain-containing protein [Gephyromycinifex aptenodytis]|uniref:carboxyl transferase domain-containing protein n=1 Tax=Gephyromycinifex aptenodytis TaxID=2716227 RepID=UPI00144528AE|nr:carboxyl transferase domain-containing protein [Gephyromycinifex aptenodytis]
MSAAVRLAIIDRGEAAARVIAAVGDVRRTGESVTRLAVHIGPKSRAWYAREADETLALPVDEGQHCDPADVVAALVAAEVDAVWIGSMPCNVADFVAECEKVGIDVAAPCSETIRALAPGAAFAAAAQAAGVPVWQEQGAELTGARLIEADFLADGDGTVMTLGLRDVSVRRGQHLVFAEHPAPGVAQETASAIDEAVRALAISLNYRGAGVAQIALRGQEFGFLGLDVLARAEHALSEEGFGTDLIALRLGLLRGEGLPASSPRSDGHTVEVRVLAHDPENGYARSGGVLQMLSLPASTGVRIDASMREGDIVQTGPDSDPLIAGVGAWGRDRDQALDRLMRVIERFVVVLEQGVSNRSGLLSLLGHPDLRAGAVPLGWYEEHLERGALVPEPDPVALVSAAVEAYEADLRLVRAAFLASAARGRPGRPEAVGSRMLLAYRGVDHQVRVDRTGPSSYRVEVDGLGVPVDVEALGQFERRLVAGGRKRRIVAIEQGAAFRLEVDGIAHTVTREDGIVVRTGWPALVESLLVSVGDEVTAGTPLATLESMKMVSTVTAAFDGVITSIAVLPNSQVERGAPLMRIRANGEFTPAALSAGLEDEPNRLDLTPLVATESPGRCGAAWVYSRLADYLLGYDLDPAGLKCLLARQKELAAQAPADDRNLLAHEDALLDLYADIAGLYRPRTEAEFSAEPEALGGVNTQEYFIAFLQWLDADRAGLPARYRVRLERALARYDVSGLEHSSQLESAMLWMFRSFSRVPALVPAILVVLERRLQHHEEFQAFLAPADRERLERLAAAAQGRELAVAGLAHDTIYALFDEPALNAVVEEERREAAEQLAALRSDPHRLDRDDRVEQLVKNPHPMRGLLLEAWRQDVQVDPDFRVALLEAYLRRFYRNRDLRGLDLWAEQGSQFVAADYEHEGRQVHLVAGFAALSDLPAFAGAVRRHLQGVPESVAVTVDVVAWREGVCMPIADMIAEVDALLAASEFGRVLHRFDVTVTSLSGVGKENRRTQHLTYRQQGGRFVEDALYRNLHPMLAKRLEIWRLSNFDLERLPSPEEVYLFLGVAKENPKDRRLFALAEVRDLVPVTNEQSGAVTYPRLGRTGLEALAAMRAALATYPPRERPVANRLILTVRPTWNIPAAEWHSLASFYERLARGAGLEKLVLHVRVPAEDGSGLVDKVLYVEGIGGRGISARLGDPGPDPIRPLTAYAQKVLTAARFGSPYPYEIIRMLTPGQGEASPFPRGQFTEMDLDGEGRLVPVDREPAQNRAHLVVGEIVNYTDLVPEGLRRVAILSDPTQGLGNLAEPECRRINAALDYAAQHRLPVEWYAVSSGALIALDSGTENMDWISLTLRRIIEHTQAGGEINIIVTGINVGGQPYWNAEATMLMHTKGVLIMTPASAMVLTGKQALDFSGAVSADDNFGIGGYDRIMGPNGQAQYWAPSFESACELLLHHYDYAYVVPGERFPRRRPTQDVRDRDVRTAPHEQIPNSTFTTVGDVFDRATNPERKRPFDMRSVMRAVTDTDDSPLERWRHWQDSDTSIVWDATIGGIPVCMLGLESRTVPRKGFVPSYGPPAWTSGTLFPQASRKSARAINAASGNRPLVVLANLSGFDGSPESMRNWQLEYGAEIGRAVTNFDGPIVFVVVSRYHGGAFVVFSKQLNEAMEIAAVEGSYASVIGGAPAAATVFARDVKKRTATDPRVVAAAEEASRASGPGAAGSRSRLAEVTAAVRSEKLGEVADEFDGIHTIDRALRVGSVDRIITAEQLRPYIIDALERGMAKFS